MLKCEICSFGYHHLGSHIWHKHKIKAREYKKMFGLDYNHALIDDDIKLKKQVAFEKDREKYLKNLSNSEQYRFKKGEINREYFSQESQERYNQQLEEINSNTTKLLCPLCEVRFSNLQVHLNTKHRIKMVKI